MSNDAHRLFHDTLQRYERPLIRYAMNMVGQLDDARDIVQDVFIKFSQTMHTVDAERLAPWLFTVCKNRATDHLRKHHRVTLMETEKLDLEESASPRPGFDLEQQETAEQLRQMIQKLPAKQREAVHLKFVAGLSYKEISDTMKTSVGNVGYLIHHAVQTMREQWLDLEAQPQRAA